MAGISITLAGNFGKLDELKSKAAKTAGSIKAAFGSNLGKAMFAGVATSATAAFAGIAASVKSAIDAGGALADQMARTGAAGKGLFILGQAFKNAGLEASQVPQTLNKMQKALAGVNEDGELTSGAFAKLGLSVSNLKALDPVDAFQETAVAIASISDPAERATVAMELFGKSGGALLAVMRDPKAFSSAAEQVGELAGTLADSATELDAVGDSLGLVGVKFQQVGAQVAVSLLPHLTEFSDWMNETDFSGIGGGIAVITERAAALGTKLSEITDSMKWIFAVERKIIDKIVGVELTDADRTKAKETADEWAKNDKGYMKETGNGTHTRKSSIDAPAPTTPELTAKEITKAAEVAAKAEKAATKKADADKKSAAEKVKSRAAAQSEYNLESAILSAKIAGDAKRLAALEREKKVREEIRALESAGFTAGEARIPAEAKADAEKKASDLEEKAKTDAEKAKLLADARKGSGMVSEDAEALLGGDKAQAALAQKRRSQELQDTTGMGKGEADGIASKEGSLKRLEDLQQKKDGMQYESSVGAVSSMQSIGGGGGVASSGLNYQRQAVDLQRSMVEELQALRRDIRPSMDD